MIWSHILYVKALDTHKCIQGSVFKFLDKCHNLPFIISSVNILQEVTIICYNLLSDKAVIFSDMYNLWKMVPHVTMSQTHIVSENLNNCPVIQSLILFKHK